MGFRPNYFTCIAHLYLYYTLLVLHTYASYIRHWCIFSYYEIQYKSSSISNMVLEPLLWHFLSSLVFISVTPFFFSISLPPSQQPPQSFAVEPPTSSSRRPWVLDLQPPSLRSFTLHRPLTLASPLQTLLQLRFWCYHRDRLAPIYKTVKASTPSETARAPTRRSKFLYGWSHAPHAVTHLQALPHAATHRHALPRACTRKFSPADISPRWHHHCHVICWRHRLTRLLTCVDFDSGLTFSIQVLFTQFFT